MNAPLSASLIDHLIEFNCLDDLERLAYSSGNVQLARLAEISLARKTEIDEYQTELETTLESRYAFKNRLEAIEALITEASWRTGKKAELRELVDAIKTEIEAALCAS